MCIQLLALWFPKSNEANTDHDCNDGKEANLLENWPPDELAVVKVILACVQCVCEGMLCTIAGNASTPGVNLTCFIFQAGHTPVSLKTFPKTELCTLNQLHTNFQLHMLKEESLGVRLFVFT